MIVIDKVGSYYKVPKYPIWVIGSTSHFTVLFSLNTTVNHESIAEKMLTTLQRSFKAIDIDECGFIPSSKLIEVYIRKHNIYLLLKLIRLFISIMICLISYRY